MNFVFHVLQPILVSVLLNQIFEIEMFIALCASIVAYIAYLVYTFSVNYSKWAYDNAFLELENELKEKNNEYDLLLNEYHEYYSFCDKDISLKKEGIASLMVQVKEKGDIITDLQGKITVYKKGEALSNALWEIERLEKENSKAKELHQKELTSLKQNYEASVTKMQNEISELQSKNKQVSKDLELLPEMRKAYLEKQITIQKQRLYPYEKANNKEKIAETASNILALKGELASLQGQ